MTPRDEHPGRAFPVIGVLVMAIGVVHEISAVIIYGPDLWHLLARGFNGSSENPAAEDAGFWSFLFGLMVIAAGQQIFWAGRRHRVISIVPAFFLLGIGLAGGWVFPFAPFWGAAVLGAVMLVLVLRRRSRRGDDSRAHPAPQEGGGD